MIVSIATAVFPVWRSPMMSSRWPRPIGTIESMDFNPVCTGWLTDCRSMTPGATFSIGAERVDDAAEHLGADGHLENAARGLDLVAFRDVLVVAEHDGADGALLEVQREAVGVAGELDHLAVLHVVEPVNAADAVRQRDDRADVAGFGLRFEVLNALPNQLANFGSFDSHVSASVFSRRAFR